MMGESQENTGKVWAINDVTTKKNEDTKTHKKQTAKGKEKKGVWVRPP